MRATTRLPRLHGHSIASEWKFIRKKGVGGEWFTESQPDDQKVAGCEVHSGNAVTPVSCSFTPATPGSYHLLASVRDSSANASMASVSVTGS